MSDWQTIATFLCLAVAGVFLAWRLLRFVRGGQRASCGSCPSSAARPRTKPLVPLELPDQRR